MTIRTLLWLLLGLSACAPAARGSAGIIAEQTFNELSGSAYTTDSVTSGGRLSNGGAFNEGGPGLGFETFWFDTRGVGAGPVVPGNDADDYVGVNTFGGGGAPNVGPSGAPVGDAERNFQFNDGDGRLELTFAPVDVSDFNNRVLSLDYWINSTSYEADDAFTVTLLDGNKSVDVLTFGESGLEENASADDRGIGWRNLSVDLEALLEDGLGETLTLTVGVDTNSGAETVFIDNVTFAYGAQDTGGGAGGVIPIHEVQGSGDASALVGQTVTIEGVVVGDFQYEDDVGTGGSASDALLDADDGDLGGFYVQEEADDVDSDPATSEGLFVYAPGLDAGSVSVGDRVRVTGQVTEYETSGGAALTQLADVSDVRVVGTAELPPPVEITLPLASRGALESLEGMRVTLPQVLVISEIYNYDRFGEIVLSLPLPEGESRAYTPTSYLDPDTQQDAVSEAEEAAAQRRITLDDGRSAQNAFPARHPNGEPLGENNLFRAGDTLANIVGVLDDSFGGYRVQPTGAADYTQRNPRPDAPEAVGGSLRVASFNLLNFFTTLTGSEVCGANQNLGCRGADTEEEFERQRAKIIEALLGLDADVVGLVELENTPGADPLGSLTAGLNARLGADTYRAVDTGTLGTDAIRVGILYKTDAVVPVGETATLSEPASVFVGPGTSRVPLAQSFVTQMGSALTVVVNHFKSKGCGGAEGANRDRGQGCYNARRTEAAEATAAWLGTDPTGVTDADVLFVGDLNAYDEESPIDALKAAGYTDLVEMYQGEFAYSYVFDGLFGYLDYALANSPLLPQVTGSTEWHINADEPDIWDYDTSYNNPVYYQANPYRTSDHDPVLVGLDLSPDPQVALEALQQEVGALGSGSDLGVSALEQIQTSLQANETETALDGLGAFREGLEGEALAPEARQRLLFLTDALTNALR